MNEEDFLFELALKFRRETKQILNIKNWFGRCGGSSQRKYKCYICDSIIDTESAKYCMTIHAMENINKHKLFHLKESKLISFL